MTLLKLGETSVITEVHERFAIVLQCTEDFTHYSDSLLIDYKGMIKEKCQIIG